MENKYQKQIDEKHHKLSKIKNELTEIEFKDIDIEKEIEQARKSHDWSEGERCSHCGMKKTTTFAWKTQGIRDNFSDGFKAEALDILEGSKCEGRE